MATNIGCPETSGNNKLTCDVCFKEFTEPKLLSCLHSFCAGCLTNLLQDNLITCPTCHVQTQVTGIPALPSNIFISSVLSSRHFQSNCSQESKVCSACDDEGLKSVCQECRYFLCDDCTRCHKKQKSTRNHKIVTIEKFKSSTSASCSMFISLNCEKHDGEVIKIFCSSCEETLCRDCVIVNHRDHSVQEIKNAFEEVKPELNGLVQKVDDVGKMLEQAVASVHQMENNVRSTADSQIDKVNDVFEDVVKHIYKRKQQLIDSILQEKTSKLKVLNAQVKGFSSDLASLNNASKFTKETLERNDSYEVLTVQKSLKRRLFKLVEEERDFHLRENDDIVFREKNIPQILQLINEMGAVTATACATECVVEEMAKVVDLVESSQTFKVVVYDKKGCPVSCGGMSDDLSVQVTGCETKEKTPVTVHDNLDGSYTVTYQLLVPGQYQIEVMLGADHIKGSPFQLTALIPWKGFEQSSIIGSNRQYLQLMLQWISSTPAKGAEWDMCFSTKNSGFSSKAFHNACDNKQCTITIVQVGDYIFGGYSDLPWAPNIPSGSHYKSSSCWIFSLKNSGNVAPFKILSTKDSSYAIYSWTGYGPTFGGADLLIANDANINTDSYTNLGHSYEPPSGYTYGTTEIKSLLAGTYNFSVTNYEVFYKK